MPPRKTSITINSIVAYVTSFLLTTIIHEAAHALAGLANHSSPVLHHNFVEHLATDNLSVHQLVVIGLAGPLASLSQGILAGIVYSQYKNQSLTTLYVLWISVLGFSNFLGYLMTGPLFSNGDIGSVYQRLEVPLALQLLGALLGATLLLFIAYKITTPFLKFSYEPSWVIDKQSRKDFSRSILILPWMAGSLLVTLLYLPIIAVVSIIYPVMSGMVFIFPWQNAQRIQKVAISSDRGIGKLSALSFVFLLALMAVFKLVLAPGIPF